MKTYMYLFIFVLGNSFVLNMVNSCQSTTQIETLEKKQDPDNTKDPKYPVGCDGQVYPPPSASPYVLPFQPGESYRTGLANCSKSYHRPGQPDQYAFDFDMPVGTPFIAARAGVVSVVVDNAPSGGGGVGNYVLVDHEDGTFAYYLHSPADGIDVNPGDHVNQGDILGVTGRSGLAGYPHLHFIVVKDPPEYPYQGLAISFRNAIPQDTVIKSYTNYTAAPL